jgi:predicted amidohydrolase
LARSIAAAQTIPVAGDVRANVEQHLGLARAAAEQRAQVLVFPELSLTGYELHLARDLAFSPADPRLAPLAEFASSCSMTLVVGAPVAMGSRLRLGAFILSPDGSIGIYTKRHLGAFSTSASPDGIAPPAEATVFEPGDEDPVVRFAGNPAAVAICSDRAGPRMPGPRRSAAHGPTSRACS